MITRGSLREQVGVAGADLADPLERAAVGDDQQVVGARPVSGSVRKRSTPEMKS